MASFCFGECYLTSSKRGWLYSTRLGLEPVRKCNRAAQPPRGDDLRGREGRGRGGGGCSAWMEKLRYYNLELGLRCGKELERFSFLKKEVCAKLGFFFSRATCMSGHFMSTGGKISKKGFNLIKKHFFFQASSKWKQVYCLVGGGGFELLLSDIYLFYTIYW